MSKACYERDKVVFCDRFTRESMQYLEKRHDVDFETFMKIFDPISLNGNPAAKHSYPQRTLRDVTKKRIYYRVKKL